MGLDTSHDCWHGPYSIFMKWRHRLAEVAGYPPLRLMDGFYDGGLDDRIDGLPISWKFLESDPLSILINHSDYDGEIAAEDCCAIADRLEQLMPLLPRWQSETRSFIDGLRLAARRGENVDFH